MHIAFPYHFDGRGRTAAANTDDHVRDLIEQILFTAPGERVNRPDFGTGLQRLVFAPNSPELASATEFLVQGALQRWLADVIEVLGVDVQSHDSTLRVKVRYRVSRTQEESETTFSREL